MEVNVVWVVAMAVALGTPVDAQKEARDLLERWLEVQNQGDFQAYQALYAADFSGVLAAEGHPLIVWVMRSAGAGPTLVSASASMWMGDCSDGVSGSLWALWELAGPPDAPRLVLRNQPDESMNLQPSAAVDVDGDGRPELLFRNFSDDAVRNV